MIKHFDEDKISELTSFVLQKVSEYGPHRGRVSVSYWSHLLGSDMTITIKLQKDL